ncbi:MAG TPA: carboxypeptidase-like regulatory domain-containing protein [Fodinibius sp.]|nr:carboxypeptidase-like regulatory domain-containing protein [Fodinibius sp.]
MKIPLRKICFWGLLLLFALAATPDSAIAQTTGKKANNTKQPGVKLSGIVMDEETEHPVSNAKVYVEQDSTTTDEEGRFSFRMLKPGEHTVLVKAEGYDDWSQTVKLLPKKQSPKMLTVELVPSDRSLLLTE